MFSDSSEKDQSRFGATSEFHKIAKQIVRLKKKHQALRADFDKDAVSPGAAKHHVLTNLLKEVNAHIVKFNQAGSLEETAECEAKIQFCQEMLVMVEACVESKRTILEMRRNNTEGLESVARAAVNFVAAAAWYFSPISYFGGGLAAAAVAKYSGDNLVANYEDSPAKNTRTQEILEDLKTELSAAITMLNISLGRCDDVDPTLFGAAPPSARR